MKTIAEVLEEIDRCVKQFDAFLEKVTDTRAIWTRSALLEMKAFILDEETND